MSATDTTSVFSGLRTPHGIEVFVNLSGAPAIGRGPDEVEDFVPPASGTFDETGVYCCGGCDEMTYPYSPDEVIWACEHCGSSVPADLFSEQDELATERVRVHILEAEARGHGEFYCRDCDVVWADSGMCHNCFRGYDRPVSVRPHTAAEWQEKLDAKEADTRKRGRETGASDTRATKRRHMC